VRRVTHVVECGEGRLGELGRPFAWHDFRQYDLDAPFPDVLHVAERGFRTQAEKIVQMARDNGYTLRETVQAISAPRPTPFAGSPETVANEMQRWFEGRALDGYNIHIGHPSQFRRFTGEVVPILREHGLVRTEYESATLRGNLGLPVPENRLEMLPAMSTRTKWKDTPLAPGLRSVVNRWQTCSKLTSKRCCRSSMS